MSESEKEAQQRRIEMETDIRATPEAVWNALATGEGLEQWFPPHAKVEGGVGGTIWLSWGDGIEGTAKIEVWEPESRLRSGEEWGGVHSSIEWTITAQSGGMTRVRLVHAGFGPEAQWDDYYEGTTAGWTYFLLHLKHYLERFSGMKRVLLRERPAISVGRDEAWSRILVRLNAEAAEPGAAVALTLGDRTYDAVVEVLRAPRGVSFRIPDLNDALLFVELEPGPTPHCGIWLSTCGLSDERNAELQSALGPLAADLSPAGEVVPPA